MRKAFIDSGFAISARMFLGRVLTLVILIGLIPSLAAPARAVGTWVSPKCQQGDQGCVCCNTCRLSYEVCEAHCPPSYLGYVCHDNCVFQYSRCVAGCPVPDDGAYTCGAYF